MEKMQSQADADGDLRKPAGPGRSFAKDIAELALFLELTEPADAAAQFDIAVTEIAQERGIPASTLKRCASEARALIAFARESGAVADVQARTDGSDWDLRQKLAAWLDDTNLRAVLKQRALRLNRRRGGRPPTPSRTLRAVEELVAFARAGRPGAADELRSIRALVADA